MEEPLAHPLMSAAKKYLGELSKSLADISLDRYHHVLVLVENHSEDLTQKALAEILHIDKSYMVNMLDYLGGKGYIIREKNPHDRREQLVTLTDKAKKELPAIKKAIRQVDSISFKTVSESKRQIFNEVLYTIQDNLSDLEPATSPSSLDPCNFSH